MDKVSFQRIYCGVQNYDWGMKGTDPNCEVYKLFNDSHFQYKFKDKRSLKQSDNYAELWMGNHKNLPALMESGEYISVAYQFLFKVLSVDRPLSIQLHPNKEQALKLHQLRPKEYPDANHKPEMTIALGRFEALIGFAPKEKIIQNIHLNPKIVYYIGEGQWSNFKNSQHPEDEIALKRIIGTILNWPDKILMEVLDNYVDVSQSIEATKKEMNNLEQLDVGYVFKLMMNHIIMKEGEAIFIPPGCIHAYLKGNCIEVMANSDNVIRCGFTQKYKDAKTLVEIIVPIMGMPNLVQPSVHKKGNHVQKIYSTEFDEFMCTSHTVGKGCKSGVFHIGQNAIILCMYGQGSLYENGKYNNYHIHHGETVRMLDPINMYIEAIDDILLYVCEPKPQQQAQQ